MDSPHRQPTKFELRLPVELWLHVIGFLRLEPHALLACCLTCRSFHGSAAMWLSELSTLRIDISNHTDINYLLESIRLAPNRVKGIRNMTLEVDFLFRPGLPVALSATLYGLAGRLVNLTRLTFSHVPNADLVHWSAWPQFGRAFPRAKELSLSNIQFPSFVDFTRFLTSFRATRLETLSMRKISWVHQPEVISRRISRTPFKQALDIDLGTDGWGHVGLRHLRTLLEWVLPRGGVVSRYYFTVWPLNSLRESKSISLSDIGILEMIHTRLRHLIFSCGSLREDCLQFDWRVWRNVFSLGFQDLRSMEFWGTQGSHVPYTRIIIAYMAAISQTPRVTLYYPQFENSESDVWQRHTLDVILFALHRKCHIRAHVRAAWIRYSDLGVSREFPLLSVLNVLNGPEREDDE